MYRFAQYVVRHKVGATAVFALGVFFMLPDNDEQNESANNPWASQPAATQVASNDEPGFMSDLMDEATSFLDENDINPMDHAEDAVGRFDQTASAYTEVNERNAR